MAFMLVAVNNNNNNLWDTVAQVCAETNVLFQMNGQLNH